MANLAGGQIVWNLDVDSRSFDTGLKRASTQADDFGKKLNTIDFKALGDKAGSTFNNIADSIAGVATKLGVLATVSGGVFLKSAADLQQTSKSFEVLTGNVTVANKLFAQLADFAAKTPFEFPQIAKAGQTLLGFGIRSDQVFDKVKLLGDIAAATGADFNSLAVVFGQVNATGRLMGQDALQLINNNVPITTILAKKLGKSVQQVKADMEAGAISVDLFNQALLETTQKGGFAFQGTEILAQSLNGRLSTLKDTVLEFGRNLLGVKVDPELGLVIKPGGLFDRISNVIPRITARLQALAPELERIVGTIIDNGPTIVALLKSIAASFVGFKILGVLAPLVGSFMAALSGGATVAGAAIAALGGPVVLIGVAIVALVSALTFLQERFNIIGKFFDFIKGIGQQIADTFKPNVDELGKAFGRLFEELKPLGEAFGNIARALGPEVMKVLGLIAGVVGTVLIEALKLAIEFIKLTIDAFTGLINIITDTIDAFKSIASKVGRAFDDVKNIVTEKVNIITDNVSKAWNSITTTTTSTFNGIKDTISNTFNVINIALEPWKRDFLGTLQKTFNSAVDMLIKYDVDTLKRWKNSLETTLTNVQRWGSDVLTAIGQTFTNAAKAVGDFFTSLPGKAQVAFDTTIAVIVAFGINLYNTVVTALGNTITGIENFFGSIPGVVESSLTATIETVKQWGINLYTGFTTGLGNVFQSITDFFTSLPEKINGFLTNTGKAITDTTTKGITDQMKARETIDKIGLAIIGAFLLVLASIAIFLFDMGLKIVGYIRDGIVEAIKTGVKWGELLINAGKDMINGFIKGIGDAAKGVGDTVKGIGDSAVKTLKNLLGIKSPSTVFTAIGENVTQGFINGITGNQRGVENALSGMLNVTGSSNFLAPSILSDSQTGTSVGGTVINQTNNVFNQVDMDLANRDLGWRLANA